MPSSPRRLSIIPLLALALPACRGASHLQAAVMPEPGCRAVSAVAPAVASADPAPTVRWIVAPDSRERVSLDRWCAGVGPVVTHARADTAAAGARELVVLSWNTHVGGGDIAGMVRDIRAGHFTDGVPVDQFVLLLQEVHRAGADVPVNVAAAAPKPIHTAHATGRRVDIVETARALGLELFYVPSMANGRSGKGLPEDRGNAILSTLPLRELTAIELPYEAQRRVVAAATVRGTTTAGTPWSLRLVNVHLDNRSRASRFLHSLGGARTRQARALVQALADDSATVVGGDMNTWSLGFMEGAVGVLQQHFPLPAQHPTEATFATAGLRLDRLMFRLPPQLSAETRRLPDRRGSDHHALIGTIRFGDDQ